MSADATKSADDRPRRPPPRGARRGGEGRARGPTSGTPRPVPTATPDKPSLREVRAALAMALAEADRPEELEEAVEAYRRGGLDGLFADQGRTVGNRVLELVGRERKAESPGLEPDPADPEAGPDPDADPLDDEEPE